MRARLETTLFLSVRYSALFLPFFVVSGIVFGGLASYMGVLIVFGYYFLVEFILWTSGLDAYSNNEDEFEFTDPRK